MKPHKNAIFGQQTGMKQAALVPAEMEEKKNRKPSIKKSNLVIIKLNKRSDPCQNGMQSNRQRKMRNKMYLMHFFIFIPSVLFNCSDGVSSTPMHRHRVLYIADAIQFVHK